MIASGSWTVSVVVSAVPLPSTSFADAWPAEVPVIWSGFEIDNPDFKVHEVPGQYFQSQGLSPEYLFDRVNPVTFFRNTLSAVGGVNQKDFHTDCIMMIWISYL